jgi:predicted AlkP superfamily pyrophosphatase or phosphodiesterase
MRLAMMLGIVLGLGYFSVAQEKKARSAGPKLAVLIYFDQLRGDFLDRWRDLYIKDGFRRLMDDGAWFIDCHYPYANTFTGPGHATCASGCSPDVHGIVANDWYDRKAGKNQYCAGSVRYQQVPPPLPSADKSKSTTKAYTAAPDTLLAPTLGDALKLATDGKGKVVALSYKDRGAVLPGGKRADAIYWVDKEGRLVTSSYYRDRVHPWVEEINKSTLSLTWLNTQWTKLRPDLDYEKYSGPDDGKGEDKGSFQGVTFPHPFDGGPKKLLSAYHAAVANSPMGNDFLLEVTKRAIVAEKLGQREELDFLSVSFSSNDLVGHCWGPDSQEVLDITLRTDRLMRDLLNFLDEKVGKGNYILALTADHGICPLPEVARAQGHPAGRASAKKLLQEAEDYLNAQFPPQDVRQDETAPRGWIAAGVSNMVYLNPSLAKDRRTTMAAVSQKLADWLQKQPQVQAAYTAEQMQKGDLKGIAAQVQRSFYAERSGDVMIVLEPYHFFSSSLTGTTHGSPHLYDTHVPLLVYGPGVKPGVRKERVSPEAAAVILAEGLGIAPPIQAAVKVPEGLFTMETNK